jgi:hypothetical protein
MTTNDTKKHKKISTVIPVAALISVSTFMGRHQTTPNTTKADDSTSESSLLTSTEVTSLLRVNRATLCRYCRLGMLPHTRMPNQSYRFDRNLIRSWIADGL